MDDWVTERLEDPNDMGNPHKSFVVHGERGFWVVEKQNKIVGCVGAIHRPWSDLKKVSFTSMLSVLYEKQCAIAVRRKGLKIIQIPDNFAVS